MLASFFMGYQQLITPSSFAVGPDGRWLERLREPVDATAVRESYLDTLTELGSCGLAANSDAEGQLVPLPKAARTDHDQLTGRLAREFRQYLREVVAPFVTCLRSLDTVVVCADIAQILAAGPTAKNTQAVVLEHVIRTLRPGSTRLRRAVDYVKEGRYIRRMIFVSTKCDRVHADYRGDRLIKLLKALVKHARGDAALDRRFDTKYRSVSAVDCTSVTERTADGEPVMRQRDPETGQIKLVRAAMVPDSWPDDWDGRSYFFPILPPRFPANAQNPPDHIDLDQLVALLLKEG